MSTDPIATAPRGASETTTRPTVRTRKKVPMNSVAYRIKVAPSASGIVRARISRCRHTLPARSRGAMLLIARAVPAPHRLAEPGAADRQIGVPHVRRLEHRPAPGGEAQIHGIAPIGVLDPERDRAPVHARGAGVAAEDEHLDEAVAVEVGLGRLDENRSAVYDFQRGAVRGDHVLERLENRALVGLGYRRGIRVEE